MYELLSVPHESEVMSMRKGIYGIFSNVSYPNFALRPKTQKQRLKRKRLATLSKRFQYTISRDNA